MAVAHNTGEDECILLLLFQRVVVANRWNDNDDVSGSGSGSGSGSARSRARSGRVVRDMEVRLPLVPCTFRNDFRMEQDDDGVTWNAETAAKVVVD